MSLTVRILIGLVVGLSLGILLGAVGPAWQPMALVAADTVGGLWMDGLRMTIIPLVFALLVVGIARVVGAGAAGGLATRSLLWFAGLLLASALLTAVLMPLLLSIWPPPQIAVEGLRAGAATVPPEVQPMGAAFLRSFIPVNPVQTAAEGQVAPLVVFAGLFGLAATRLAPDLRDRIVGFFDAVAEAMLVLVGWVLWLGPAGVFALAVGVGARAGAGAAGALLHYVILISAVCITMGVLMYPLVVAVTRISPLRFARAALPAQVVAFSTQSSIASLPSMFGGARSLGVSDRSAGVVLPLAVSLFRITSPAANLAVAIYVAHVTGLHLSPGHLLVGALVAATISFASVGLPGQITFFTTIGPVSLAMGVPVTLLPLLLAVEVVPDIFRTIGNVTADLAVTKLAAHGAGEAEEAD